MTTHTTTTNEKDRRRHEEGDKRAPWNLRALIAKGGAALMAASVLLATPRLLAAQNPWEDAVNNLMTAMTGPIAKGLSLIAIVIGGLMFAFGEGGSKRTLAGIIFGVGMAMGAVSFLDWMFG